MGRWIGIAGSIITAVYFAFLAWALDGRWSQLRTKDLNEVGDFLAGAFAPLAFLWLVLGFIQQGIELRQNSHALHLQAEELRNSVEQQKALVEVARLEHEASTAALKFQREQVARELAEAEKASQPRFVFSEAGMGFSGGSAWWNVNMTNTRMDCSEVSIRLGSSSQLRFNDMRVAHWGHGQRETSQFTVNHFEGTCHALLLLSYVDARGRVGTAEFEVAAERTGIAFVQKDPKPHA